MFVILIIYSITILGLWLLFLISRVHSYKFKHYSRIIAPVTRFIAIIFIIGSILGYIFIFIGLNNNESNNYSHIEDKMNYEDTGIDKNIEDTGVDNSFDVIY